MINISCKLVTYRSLVEKKELQEGNLVSFGNKGCRTLFVNVCAEIRPTR